MQYGYGTRDQLCAVTIAVKYDTVSCAIVLWPTLCNVLIGGALRLRLPYGTSIVDFADDMVLMVRR